MINDILEKNKMTENPHVTSVNRICVVPHTLCQECFLSVGIVNNYQVNTPGFQFSKYCRTFSVVFAANTPKTDSICDWRTIKRKHLFWYILKLHASIFVR